MRKIAEWCFRGLVMAAWVGSVIWLSQTGDDSAIWVVVVASVVAGLLANTWWVLALPHAVVAALTVEFVVAPPERTDFTVLGIVVIFGAYAVLADVFLGGGVALRRALHWRRGPPQSELRSTYAR